MRKTPLGDGYRASCEAMLKVAQQVCPSLLLSDNRLMGTYSAQDLAWLAESFTPRFAQLSVNQAALVHTKGDMSHLAMAAMLDRATPHIGWQDRFFTSYDEAWSWLTDIALLNQPHWMLSQDSPHPQLLD